MIVGAGFAGLISAHIFPREQIIESAPEPLQAHRALLRFRSDVVGKLTGVDFRKVRVRKGLFINGMFSEPNIHLANAYSQKCLGEIVGERSIWNLDPVDRFIAPETFYEQLIDAVGTRIKWGTKADYLGEIASHNPIISTAPLPVVLREVVCPLAIEFNRAPITVMRYRLDKCDVHQTIYYPTSAHSLYRASITGDLLLCEFAGEPTGDWQQDVISSFCLLSVGQMEPIDVARQSYGKIAPVDNGLRKALIHDLSVRYNIFSIGRFATWRNVLLDDIVNDAAVVKKLISAAGYERRIAAL